MFERFPCALQECSRRWQQALGIGGKDIFESALREDREIPKVSSSQSASILSSYQRIREVAVADGRSGQSAQIGDTGRKRTSDSIFKLMPWDYRRVVFACFPIRTQQDSPR